MRNQMQIMFKLEQEREFVLISIEHGRYDTNKKTLEFMLTYTLLNNELIDVKSYN